MIDRVAGRAEISGEIGEILDKSLEQARSESEQRKGMRFAYKDAGEKVSKLHDHVNQSRDEDELPLSFSSQAEAASYINRWITRAVEICGNLSEKSQAELLVANGKQSALRDALKVVQRYHNTSVSRYNQLTSPPEEEDPESEEEGKQRRRNRRPGEHPGRSALDERRAAASSDSDKSDGNEGKESSKKVASKKAASRKKGTNPKKKSVSTGKGRQ